MKTKLIRLIVVSIIASRFVGLAQQPPTNAQDVRPAAQPPAVVPVVPVVTVPATPVTSYTEATVAATNLPVAELVPLIVIEDSPLIDAIKNLARLANINIHFDPRVLTQTNLPSVTVRFENVTAVDALTEVLENYNYKLIYNPKTKISKVTIKDPKAEEPLFTQIFQLKYSSPSNLVTVLRGTFYSPRNQFVPDTRTSQLIVVTTQKEMEAVQELLAKLDTPTRQILIEAHILETAKNPKSVKGIDWSGTLAAQNFSFGNGVTVGTTTTTIPGVQRSTTLPGGRVITTQPGHSEATVLNTVQGNGGISANTKLGFSPSIAFLNADGVHAVLSFLNTDNDTEVISTPRTVTLDNETATLSVTRAFPIFQITPGSANTPAGGQVTYTNLGTILTVTPRIAAGSNIAMRVVPEVSNIDSRDQQVLNGTVNTANIYAIRRAETHVMIPSGNTLVMGGLMNDTRSKGYTKVPLLGDIPGVGMAFRSSNKQRTKSNLLLFITPSIIADSDFQLAQSDFLKNKLEIAPDQDEKPYDSGKPYDWTKPIEK
jgi:type II secretory pathway component GspD/PulD (secretin)